MGDASGENVGEAVDGSSAKAGMEGAFRESRFPPQTVYESISCDVNGVTVFEYSSLHPHRSARL